MPWQGHFCDNRPPPPLTQVAYELAVGALVVALLWASSALGPGRACALSWVAHLAALACLHLLMHTAVLAAGCRACARVGASAALVVGLVAICGYCHVLVSTHYAKP